jgi:uncharacterized membrane protein (DUF373 family)
VAAVRKLALQAYQVFERLVVFVLLLLLMVVVAWSTSMLVGELGVRLFGRLTGGPQLPVAEMQEFFDRFRLLHEVFGAFLLILIGLELMKTVVMYLERHELHVEVVFTVAMIAIARHAISLNLETISPMTLLGMAGLIAGLSIGYYFFRKSSGLAGHASGPEFGGAKSKSSARME